MNIIDANDRGFTSGSTVGAFKGVVKNLLNHDYHQLKSYWSSTQLKYLCDSSPAHFQNEYLIPKIKPESVEKLKEDRIVGSLVHSLCLTPEDFNKEFILLPDLNMRTNEGKAEYAKLIEENVNKVFYKTEWLERAKFMHDSVMKNGIARSLIEGCQKELAIFWDCVFSGLPMKAKIDGFNPNAFVELKTTTCASKEEFEKQIDNLHYDLSLVHYNEGIKNRLKIELPAFFIVVENKAPYVTQVYQVASSLWDTGRDKWITAVTKLEAGVKKNEWPGYFKEDQNDIPKLEATRWAMSKLMKGDINA